MSKSNEEHTNRSIQWYTDVMTKNEYVRTINVSEGDTKEGSKEDGLEEWLEDDCSYAYSEEPDGGEGFVQREFDDGHDEGFNGKNENVGGENNDNFDNALRTGIDFDDGIAKMDLASFSPHLITLYDFPNLDVAYKFYCKYAKANGFSVREGRILHSKKTNEELNKIFGVLAKEFDRIEGLKKDRMRQIRP
ncbi:hypothetical protein SESBI_33874 [Sesbania bispinosa]|nr:hypothetical protein SESBI_33874 [Sesbania bispinosa]